MTSRPLSTPGRRPYGTERGEAAVIRTILARRRRGDTWQAIADHLNAAGRLQRNGKPWSQQRVAGVAATQPSSDA